ncbi:MAG: triose-phosphate isomerase [Chloroflexi bacterium RBG_16_50_9]|nr:MAG: triose-phosphate isomerase [Chloroflexi bacterium RBG_16_50_9]
MRTPLIAGNWKMNTTVADAVKLVKSMLGGLEKVGAVERVICPPFVSLAAVKDLIKKSSVKLGAQNVFYEEKGAFTGEISPLMLADLCEYVIIGHSERRQYFGETGEIIDKKIKAVLQFGLKPILCIGERLEENESGRTKEVLTRQLLASLDRSYFLGGLVIAYEPVWAIGTGKSATGEQANQTIGFIRQFIADQQGNDTASKVRILYGGSVTADNITEFMRQPDIDGALVGGASLKADEFLSIVKKTAEIRGLA